MFVQINKRIINVNHIIEVVDYSASGGPRQVRLTPQDAESEPESRLDLTAKEYDGLIEVLIRGVGVRTVSDPMSPNCLLTKGEQKLRLATARN